MGMGQFQTNSMGAYGNPMMNQYMTGMGGMGPMGGMGGGMNMYPN
jgi:hypothetical protein